MEEQNTNIKVLLLYGKLLLECNFDLSEIRNDLYQLMSQLQMNKLSIFMTQTSLMLIDEETDDVKMIKSENCSYNFEKVSHIHQVILQFSTHHIDIEELYQRLQKIDKRSYAFSVPTQVFHAGIICGAMYCLINGATVVSLYAFFLGSLGYFVFLLLQKSLKIKLFAIFLYSIFVSICAMSLYTLHMIDNDFALILSCMMPLFPGATLVNAIRAGINGDYIVSLSQGVEAVNTALMLGLPVAVLLTTHF